MIITHQFIFYLIEINLFRCYNSSQPSLVITDPELVKEVMVKQFENFPNRIESFACHVKYIRKIVSELPVEEWRPARAALSPTFTGAKLKKMVSLMNNVVDNFSKKLASLTDNPENEIDFMPLFKAYTMDIICNVVFGLKVDTQVSRDVFKLLGFLCIFFIAQFEFPNTCEHEVRFG